MRSVLLAVAASAVVPSSSHMRLESNDGLQKSISIKDIQMAVDPLGKMSAWHPRQISAFADVSEWPAVNTSVGTDPIGALNAKHQMYTDLLDDGFNDTKALVMPAVPDFTIAAVPMEKSIAAPMVGLVNSFVPSSTAKAMVPVQLATSNVSHAGIPMPPDLPPIAVSAVSPDAGADAVVQQAELAKEQQAKAAALKVQAAEEAKINEKDKLKDEKAAAEKAKAQEAAKAAALANSSAPFSASVAAFVGGPANATVSVTPASKLETGVIPLSLLTLSIRPAAPPVGLDPTTTRRTAYERKRGLLWNALSSGMSISPHHDMPVSRSLSLLEFVHTTHSHAMLMAVVPSVVLGLVLVALALESWRGWGMLKGCSTGRHRAPSD